MMGFKHIVRQVSMIISMCLVLTHPSITYASKYTVDIHTFRSVNTEGDDHTEDDIGPGRTTPMKKGDVAPFDGVLIDDAAAARLIVERRQSEARCDVIVERELAIAAAKNKLKVDTLQAKYTAEKRRRALESSLNEERVEYLSKALEQSQRKNSRRDLGGLCHLVRDDNCGVRHVYV